MTRQHSYVPNWLPIKNARKPNIKCTFSKDQSSIVCPLSNVFESLRTVIECEHGSHVGQQSLEVNTRGEN